MSIKDDSSRTKGRHNSLYCNTVLLESRGILAEFERVEGLDCGSEDLKGVLFEIKGSLSVAVS